MPPHMRIKRTSSGKVYYYYDMGGTPRRWKPLGHNFIEALRLYTEHEPSCTAAAKVTLHFRDVAQRYSQEIIPAKAPRTQKDNFQELASLYRFFDNPPAELDEIRPLHIRQYLDWRKDAKTRANREVALLSHIFNKAREWGLTDQPNPCVGIKKHTEKGRDNYISDKAYRAVWFAADQPLRDAMDLAYLTGQRPADVLKLEERDIQEGVLVIKQNKTGAQVRIEIIGELATTLARIRRRKQSLRIVPMQLLINENGQPLSYDTLRFRFNRAREAAGIDKASFQFRDLRAKAGTDIEVGSGGNIREAQALLGHSNASMTEHYVRKRGRTVKPTK
ncbi:tyrosine-type recombinase/integrase [Mycoavidus cysteinexigens]|uniref:tyrosine-type recombinase/integrase n=1 Tax=Mycoavidus cysteinexigens TaxID=1553431 RepID=UPI001E2B2516|nr:tyrosine-type recombinase/integrase [Mycoavidus cysteinexigens]